jgi:hypothetical protein
MLLSPLLLLWLGRGLMSLGGSVLPLLVQFASALDFGVDCFSNLTFNTSDPVAPVS